MLVIFVVVFRAFCSSDPRKHTHTHTRAHRDTHTHTYIAHICSQSTAIFTNPHVLYELPANGGVLKGAGQGKCATKRERERESFNLYFRREYYNYVP